MCLAVYKPSTVLPDWDALEEGFKCNSHGAGFAVATAGSIQVHKGFFTFDEFARAYEPFADKQALIHFRLATHGNRGPDMCHPFMVTDELAMIHNGILPIDTSDDKDKSDTWHYVEYILKPLAERDRDFYSDNAIKFLGEAAISGSKFAFLRADGDWTIWNSEDGHWSGDIWYSNRSYVKSHIGFSRWPKAEAPPVIDVPAFDDPGESRYYDSLCKSDQWEYEDLLEDGFSAEELDEYIAMDGRSALKYLKRMHKYDEENV
jgi:hypothetical protein